jgi:hypothetical protein
MDQVSSPPRSFQPSLDPSSSRSVDGGPLDASPISAEPVADPGEDPYSPGSAEQAAFDPLTESLGALLGALIAVLSLAVPLLGVLSDRRDEAVRGSVPVRSIEASAPDRSPQP